MSDAEYYAEQYYADQHEGYGGMISMNIRDIADRLIDLLSAEGFTIQRYDAYGTNSVYLKLDYGVCNSIRISDHPGKKHLKYMYNVLTCHKGEPRREMDGFARYYYKGNKKQIDTMLRKIISVRDKKIHNFGRAGYLIQMKIAKAENENNRVGFWSQAVTVFEGTLPEDMRSKAEELNEGVIKW